jgi:hypothetical protein
VRNPTRYCGMLAPGFPATADEAEAGEGEQ